MGSEHPAIELERVSVRRNGRLLINDLDWRVDRGHRWVVVGPNGCGKTTLLKLVTGYLHPTEGTARVLGRTLGRTDVRDLRRHIGLTSGAVTRLLRPELGALDIVVTAKHGALEPWWHEYDDADRERARHLLRASGMEHHEASPFATLSEGERQHVLLARALMAQPSLVLLDEPAAGLDLAARERFVARLAALAGDEATPPLVFVTHHVEEIPPGFTHALLMRDGQAVAAGPLTTALTSETLSEAFGLPVRLLLDEGGRYSARATAIGPGGPSAPRPAP